MTIKEIYYELEETQEKYCKTHNCEECRFYNGVTCILEKFLDDINECYNYTL